MTLDIPNNLRIQGQNDSLQFEINFSLSHRELHADSQRKIILYIQYRTQCY